MLDLLTGFVAELRAAGIPVSLTEHLDAAEALTHVPMEDREAIKYTLGASLVKIVVALAGVRDGLRDLLLAAGPGLPDRREARSSRPEARGPASPKGRPALATDGARVAAAVGAGKRA